MARPAAVRSATAVAFALLSCGCLSLQKVPGGAAAPGVPFALHGCFDNDGFSPADKTGEGDFDGYRDSYPESILGGRSSARITLDDGRVSFNLPVATAAQNNVACNGQRVAAVRGWYSKLFVLGAGVDGARKGKLVLHYSGKQVKAELALSDWCKEPAQGEVIAFEAPARHSADEGVQKFPCRIFARSIQLDPSQELVAVTLPGNPKLRIMAMTLVK